jgi:O-antigen/teichoic acid export membrane protein
MNGKEGGILVKNAVANVSRGSASAIVALILPPFLTRLMSPDAYGTWALVLQISAYVGYLDFGIQTAIGRFVAHSNETKDAEQRDRIVNTSLAALAVAGVIGLVAVALAATFLPDLYGQMPRALVGDAQIALVLVASSLALGLPASTFNGIFVGLQKYEVPAVIIGGSRLFSAVLLILVVRAGGNLASMALTVATVNLVSYILQYIAYKKIVPGIRLSMRLISRKAGKDLLEYCFSLSVWSFAMLLVTGLDVLMVGYFQFAAVAYYAVAATLITFLAGLQNAVFSVLIPSTAVEHARGNAEQLGAIMVTATRYGSFLLLLTGLPLILAAKPILTVWVGSSYASGGEKILQVLVIANMIRLSAVPYVSALIGTGQQRLVVVTPLLEGLVNLIASIIGGYLLGALGVAVGTLLGAVVGVMGNFLYNMPRTVSIQFNFSHYVGWGLLRPLACATPVASVVLLRNYVHELAIPGFALAFMASICLVWHLGLIGSERQRLRSFALAQS